MATCSCIVYVIHLLVCAHYFSQSDGEDTHKVVFGRSSGTTSLVKRTAVKEGTIAIGQKVTVVWEKFKKTYQGEFVSSGAQTLASHTASMTEGEVFSFELTASAQQTS